MNDDSFKWRCEYYQQFDSTEVKRFVSLDGEDAHIEIRDMHGQHVELEEAQAKSIAAAITRHTP